MKKKRRINIDEDEEAFWILGPPRFFALENRLYARLVPSSLAPSCDQRAVDVH